MKTEPTPGPWAIRALPRHLEVFAVNDAGLRPTLARVDKWAREGVNESNANARLIAAAPDLLDALLLALPYVEDVLADKDQLACFKPGVVQGHAKTIRAAIAEAVGS